MGLLTGIRAAVRWASLLLLAALVVTPLAQVVMRGILGLAMVAVPLVLALLATPYSMDTVTWAVAGLELYLAVAYYVRPRPADFDRRWRAVLESPFRFTDDLNWMLWFLGVVLRPGRFATTAIVDLFRRPPSVAA